VIDAAIYATNGVVIRMIKAKCQLLLGSRVLVAEDDVILALDVERSLRDAGAEIFGPAKTAADATALARTAPLTCAVLDVNLGCELVFPAAHVLRERGINTIFCTGYDVHVLQQDWPNAQVLSKPVSSQRLIRAIRTA
jgi:ActR/RegA family two-component response regulator